MMRFICGLALVLGFNAAAQTNTNLLVGNVANYGLSVQYRVPITLSLSPYQPYTVGNSFLPQKDMQRTSDSSGNFFYTNLQAGNYVLNVAGTTYGIQVLVNTQGTVQLATLTTNANYVPPSSATNYYNIQQINAMITGLGTDYGALHISQNLADLNNTGSSQTNLGIYTNRMAWRDGTNTLTASNNFTGGLYVNGSLVLPSSNSVPAVAVAISGNSILTAFTNSAGAVTISNTAVGSVGSATNLNGSTFILLSTNSGIISVVATNLQQTNANLTTLGAGTATPILGTTATTAASGTTVGNLTTVSNTAGLAQVGSVNLTNWGVQSTNVLTTLATTNDTRAWNATWINGAAGFLTTTNSTNLSEKVGTGTTTNLTVGTGTASNFTVLAGSLAGISSITATNSSLSNSTVQSQLVVAGTNLALTVGTAILTNAIISGGSITGLGTFSIVNGIFNNITTALATITSSQTTTGTNLTEFVGTGTDTNLTALTETVGTGTATNYTLLTAHGGSVMATNLTVGTGTATNLTVGAGTATNLTVGTGTATNWTVGTGTATNWTVGTGTATNLNANTVKVGGETVTNVGASSVVLTDAGHNLTNGVPTIGQGGTGATTSSAARTALAVPGLTTANTLSGANLFTGGNSSQPSAEQGSSDEQFGLGAVAQGGGGANTAIGAGASATGGGSTVIGGLGTSDGQGGEATIVGIQSTNSGGATVGIFGIGDATFATDAQIFGGGSTNGSQDAMLLAEDSILTNDPYGILIGSFSVQSAPNGMLFGHGLNNAVANRILFPTNMFLSVGKVDTGGITNSGNSASATETTGTLTVTNGVTAGLFTGSASGLTNGLQIFQAASNSYSTTLTNLVMAAGTNIGFGQTNTNYTAHGVYQYQQAVTIGQLYEYAPKVTNGTYGLMVTGTNTDAAGAVFVPNLVSNFLAGGVCVFTASQNFVIFCNSNDVPSTVGDTLVPAQNVSGYVAGTGIILVNNGFNQFSIQTNGSVSAAVTNSFVQTNEGRPVNMTNYQTTINVGNLNGVVGNLTNGTWSNGTLTNGVNHGNAFSSPGAMGAGSFSEQFGAGATAPGTSDLAIGALANITGNSSVAIGVGANVTGNNAISISGTAGANQSIAIGTLTSTSAGAVQSVTIGYNSQANAPSSSAYGASALASGTNSTAVGQGSSATVYQASAFGSGATTTGISSITLGTSASETATNAIAIGNNVTNNNANEITLGSPTQYVHTFGPILAGGIIATNCTNANLIVTNSLIYAGTNGTITTTNETIGTLTATNATTGTQTSTNFTALTEHGGTVTDTNLTVTTETVTTSSINVGTITSATVTQLVISPLVISGLANGVNDISIGTNCYVRVSGYTTSASIAHIVGPATGIPDGQPLWLSFETGLPLTLNNESGVGLQPLSTRIRCPGGVDLTGVGSPALFHLIYNGLDSRWTVVTAPGQGSLLTSLIVGNVTNTPSFTLVQTNWIDGGTYTNNTGRPIQVWTPCIVTPASASGFATYQLRVPAGNTTDSVGEVTIVGTIIDAWTNKVGPLWVPVGGAFTFTNISQGAGNSAAILPGGQYMVY